MPMKYLQHMCHIFVVGIEGQYRDHTALYILSNRQCGLSLQDDFYMLQIHACWLTL